MTDLQKQFLSLSDDERVVMRFLIEESLKPSEEPEELTAWEKAIVDESIRSYRENPSTAISLEEFRKRKGL